MYKKKSNMIVNNVKFEIIFNKDKINLDIIKSICKIIFTDGMKLSGVLIKLEHQHDLRSLQSNFSLLQS